jgi:uncharacterized protein (TIGR03083 family)
MDWTTYLEHVQADGTALAAAAGAGLGPQVPNCPDWRVRDLLHHVGVVHRHKEFIVRRGSTEPPEGWEDPAPPPDAELVDWYRRGLDDLLTTLSASDPARPVWTWAESDQTVGFWYRRMAHETLIHRVDAEQAQGHVGPIDDALATDGIDEIVTTMLSGAPSWAELEPGQGVVRLGAPARSWNLQCASLSGTSPVTGTTYTDLDAFIIRGNATADAVVAGSAADLDLWLWGRGSLEPLEVSGDQGLADGIREVAREVTQ